jgi:heme exporter protein A
MRAVLHAGGFCQHDDDLSNGPAGCPGGGIGRRNGLKIRRSQGHAGSIPARGTIPFDHCMLTVEGLHLWRGDRHVLRGVSFSVEAGSCALLTGRNGAGKTTLLRAIAGLLEPEEGQVRWRGIPARAQRDAFHAELAYLGHEPALKGDLTGQENLRYSVGIRRGVAAAEIDAALARTGAAAFADRLVRTLSAGQRRRIALAGLLLLNASLWLLDEPATNLDADGQQLVADLAAEHLARQGLIVAAVHHSLPLPADRLLGIELAA